MTTHQNSRKLPHVWVLYVATLAPLLAIAFAFSLGPSPAKQVRSLRFATSEEAQQMLEELSAPAIPYLVDEVLRPEAAHRSLIIQYLGKAQDPIAAEALDRLSQDTNAPEGIRSEALAALKALDGA